MFNKIYSFLKEFIKDNWKTLIICLIIILINVIKLPYEVEMPGGIIKLNDRVTIDGKQTEIEGSYNMAYVSVVEGNITYILLGLIIPDWDVVPSEDVKYENETTEEAHSRDKLYLEQSISSAKVAALKAANKEFEINNKINYVSHILEGSNNTLKVGDNIIKINGEELFESSDISNIIEQIGPDKEVSITVIRDGKEQEEKAVLYEDNGRTLIGINVITTCEVESNYDIEIDTKKRESGPSGGMMMSLMIYGELTNQDLTKGRKIVGTGTINLDGTVGAIGGVKYKVMGAVKNKADLIIVPKDNYEEAIKVKEEKKYDIEIISVETLEDAIEYLEG